MSVLTTWILVASLSALLLLSTYWFLKERRLAAFVLRLVGLAFACVVLYVVFNFPLSVEAKSGSEWDDIYPVFGLYSAMALGILSQYAYAHFSQPTAERRGFDWGSPLVDKILSSQTDVHNAW